MGVPYLRAASMASTATSAVDAESAAKIPPVCNQREPLAAPKIESQSKSPGLTWLMAVWPRSEQPANERGVDAALEDEVLDEATDGVIGERGGDGGAQAKAAAQAAGHVVFAATFPCLKLARGVNTHVAGIEAKHDFAQAEAVPATAGIGN